MTKCDDKAGYDHVSLSPSSQTYVGGFQWNGFWFVCTTLLFGWKIFPYIYHTISLVASGYLRACGIPCSLYFDHRLNGELLTCQGPWSVLPEYRGQEYRFSAAIAAIYCVLLLLVDLGYTIGITKSVLYPTTSVEYLGLTVDSLKQAFIVPRRKIEALAVLRTNILGCKKYTNVKTLQRFQGKFISLSLAVPAGKLFIREISHAFVSADSNGRVSLTPALREELSYWQFLDSWQDWLSWRDEKHVRLSLFSDASGFGWGCVLHLPGGSQSCRDFWNDQERLLNISTKETLPLVNALKALPSGIRDCRVDALVDSKVLIDTWEGQGSKQSPELTSVTKKLFFVISSRNIQINLTHVPSSENPADGPSRRLSRLDSRLTRKAWERVEKVFGGPGGHSFDLMSLDSNVMLGRNGSPLPYFSPHPIPQSAGVNLFSQNLLEFVFPPFGLVGPVLKFLYPFRIPFTIVVPQLSHCSYWWPEPMTRSQSRFLLGGCDAAGVILAPSTGGYMPVTCPCPLWAFRVSRF